MSNHRYGNLTASAWERSNPQLKRSGLVQQGVARQTLAGFGSRTLANQSSEDVHFNRNMAIHAPGMEDQEQQEDYNTAKKYGTMGVKHWKMKHKADKLVTSFLEQGVFRRKGKQATSMDRLFFETHKKGATLVTTEASDKHAELVRIVQSNPALSNNEVMDRSDASKRRKHVVGFGGGVKARDLQRLALTKAELVSKLQKSEEEKQVLAENLDGVVGEVAKIKRLMFTRSSSNIPHGNHDDQVS